MGKRRTVTEAKDVAPVEVAEPVEVVVEPVEAVEEPEVAPVSEVATEPEKAPETVTVEVPVAVISNRAHSFIPVRVAVPEGHFAVLVNQGAGDIYPSFMNGRYLREGENVTAEESFTFFAPSRPHYKVNIYKK